MWMMKIQRTLIALEVSTFWKKLENSLEIKYDSTMCGYFCIGFIEFMLKVNNIVRVYKLIFLMNMKILTKKY